MSNNSNLNGDFQLVSYKKKGKRKQIVNKLHNNNFALSPPNPEIAIRRIQEAVKELKSTDLYQSFTALLRESLDYLNDKQISEIICFGLGKIGECLISRYQFALLLCLRDDYAVKVSVFDPIFTAHDKSILNSFNCCVLDNNCEGKLKVSRTTLFYLPHCAKQLTNNLLWANWGLGLNKCVIVANSFSSIIDSTPRRVLSLTGQYITNISPHVLELTIVNNFKYFEVFNATSIHVFPYEKLNIISPDLWADCREPDYKDEDVEFIKNAVKQDEY